MACLIKLVILCEAWMRSLNSTAICLLDWNISYVQQMLWQSVGNCRYLDQTVGQTY